MTNEDGEDVLCRGNIRYIRCNHDNVLLRFRNGLLPFGERNRTELVWCR